MEAASFVKIRPASPNAIVLMLELPEPLRGPPTAAKRTTHVTPSRLFITRPLGCEKLPLCPVTTNSDPVQCTPCIPENCCPEKGEERVVQLAKEVVEAMIRPSWPTATAVVPLVATEVRSSVMPVLRAVQVLLENV